jgi:hypothetical protein
LNVVHHTSRHSLDQSHSFSLTHWTHNLWIKIDGGAGDSPPSQSSLNLHMKIERRFALTTLA